MDFDGCFYHKNATLSEEVCVTLPNNSIVSFEKTRLVLVQAEGNFDWALTKRRFPHLEVSKSNLVSVTKFFL